VPSFSCLDGPARFPASTVTGCTRCRPSDRQPTQVLCASNGKEGVRVSEVLCGWVRMWLGLAGQKQGGEDHRHLGFPNCQRSSHLLQASPLRLLPPLALPLRLVLISLTQCTCCFVRHHNHCHLARPQVARLPALALPWWCAVSSRCPIW